MKSVINVTSPSRQYIMKVLLFSQDRLGLPFAKQLILDRIKQLVNLHKQKE